MENIKQTEITVVKLEAPEGAYLTQTTINEDAERVFVSVAYLAQEQTADTWRVATAEEKQQFDTQKIIEHGNQ